MRTQTWIVIFVGLIALIPCETYRCMRVYEIEVGCIGHLKRAADANTVELARTELAIATSYIEAHNLTTGNTAIILPTPASDLLFWHDNLKAAEHELDKVTKETSQLERTNTLMKLRETLMDHTSGGDRVTHPDWISVYPKQRVLAAVECIVVAGWLIYFFVGLTRLSRF